MKKKIDFFIDLFNSLIMKTCIAVGYQIDYSSFKPFFTQLLPNLSISNLNVYTGLLFSNTQKKGPNETCSIKDLETWYQKRKGSSTAISLKKCWITKTNDLVIFQLQVKNDCFYSFPININNKATTQQKKLLTTSDQFTEINLDQFTLPRINAIPYIHYVENNKNIVLS